MHWRLRHALDIVEWHARYGKRRLIRRFLPKHAHRTSVQKWERSWAAPDFAPGWAAAQIPAALREAVGAGWFPPGATVLDIGCGDGRLTRWLAEQGYDVLGVDVAAAAVAKATARHAGAGRLRFELLDICLETIGQQFDALLDRGTLHTITDMLSRKAYARTVAAAAKPGARFLLVHASSRRKEGYRDEDARKKIIGQDISNLFGSVFEVERVTDAVFGDEQEAEPFARGVAFWMVRR